MTGGSAKAAGLCVGPFPAMQRAPGQCRGSLTRIYADFTGLLSPICISDRDLLALILARWNLRDTLATFINASLY